MSGKKETTVTLGQSQYESLRMSEQQLRAMRRDLPELVARVQQQTASDLKHRIRPLEERQRQFGSAISQLQEDVRDFQQETATQLARQQRQFQQSVEQVGREFQQSLEQSVNDVRRDFQKTLDQSVTQVRREMHASISQVRSEVNNLAQQTAQQFSQQRREFEEKLQQQRREIDRRIHGVEQRVGNLEQREQHRRRLAEAWLDAADVAHKQIESNKRHEQFAPGKLNVQTRAIRQARDLLGRDAPEAALGKAQDATYGLADLLLELQQREQEWLLWQNATLGSAMTLLALAEGNRKIDVFDLKGNKLNATVEDRIETDEWTRGKLRGFEQQMKSLIGRIQSEANPLSTDELRRLAKQEIPDLEKNLEKIIQEARMEALESQLRHNIAHIVVQALEERAGFQYEGGAYEGADQRAGYVATVTHLDGGQVSVLVSPLEGQPGKNQLQINSYDVDEVDLSELEGRQAEISQVLSDLDFEVGEVKSLPRPDESVRDLQGVETKRNQHQSSA